MRKLLAVLLAGLFLILFFVATSANQVVDTASDPGVISGMLDDAGAYDYVYDNIIGNLVQDIVVQGIEVNSGLDETVGPTTLRFDDNDAAALAITSLIETLIPREYVQEKLEQSLNGVVPYARGETDEFTIDLEVQERVRLIPGVVREIVIDLNLAERVVDDVLLPQLDQFTDQISTQALGIEFTQTEIESIAREIFAPEWLEGQLFSAIDEITPYFAGDTDSFNVVLEFDDRVLIIGRILKDKLSNEGTLYNLVFAQVIDPLIQETVAQSTSVGFGIALTEAEVIDTFEIIAPRDWVEEQGQGVIDALVDYLVGKTDTLEYTVDLSVRKDAASAKLQSLARQKLQSRLEEIPGCGSPADALGAAQDIGSQQIPRCIAGGQATINLAMSTFSSQIDAQVVSFVENQVPSEVAYSRADLEARVGGGFDTIDDLRTRVIDGVRFTDQDLIDSMADGNNPESRVDAEETLRILASGILITEKNITDNFDPAALQQFNDARGYAGTAFSLRWVLWVLVLIPLLVIALIGGRGWAGRLKWAGGVAAISALIVYGGIAAAWSFNDLAQEFVPNYGADASIEFKADYPRLTAELESDEMTLRFERALDSWQQGWRNQTVPWIIGGLLAFVAGTVLSMSGRERGTSLAGGPSYKGTSPSPSTSESFSVPKDWGDDNEEDREDKKIESEKPERLDEELESSGDPDGSSGVVSDEKSERDTPGS